MRRGVPNLFELAAMAAGLVVLAVLGRLGYALATETVTHPGAEPDPIAATTPADQEALAKANPGFLYGRVTTDDGVAYEGRLRWGGGEEAFWGDYFSGSKSSNPWAASVPPEALASGRHPFRIFGFELGDSATIDLRRPFLVRLGDIARIDAPSPMVVRLTLKSGTVYDTNYSEASDFADGIRVWTDGKTVDLGPTKIQTIEFLPTARLASAPSRLYGTVETRGRAFTGFLQWNREKSVGSDTLDGRTADGKVSLRFDAIRAVARESSDQLRVTLRDNRDVVGFDRDKSGPLTFGMYVEDSRYGRVLVPWSAFERVEFSAGGSGPAYSDYPPGRPLAGTVTLRSGERLAGRLVYDLDESETTDSLDAPRDGVDYLLPFGLVASIALPENDKSGTGRAKVTLQSGEVLNLELAGDLGPRNAGLLVFPGGTERPRHVRWADVQRIEFDATPGRL
ncbi:MAG: hypothetical protein EPO35_12880 [Acidobacteria bacterium]|nr:MAG: hypothetical protein EPO35_12880 [Acidobacteriota bacterium]